MWDKLNFFKYVDVVLRDKIEQEQVGWMGELNKGEV